MKDHEIRGLVNKLRDTAISHRYAQSLREALRNIVVPALKTLQADNMRLEGELAEAKENHILTCERLASSQCVVECGLSNNTDGSPYCNEKQRADRLQAKAEELAKELNEERFGKDGLSIL